MAPVAEFQARRGRLFGLVGGAVWGVIALEFDDQRIAGIRIMANPGKLSLLNGLDGSQPV